MNVRHAIELHVVLQMPVSIFSIHQWKQRFKNQPKSGLKSQPPLSLDISVRHRSKPKLTHLFDFSQKTGQKSGFFKGCKNLICVISVG